MKTPYAYSRKFQSGFTLIELIIVIVILGILSVVVAPKFIDISSDANEKTLKGMGAAMNTARNLVYAKALIQGQTNIKNGNVDWDDDGSSDIQTRWGYPMANKSFGINLAMDESINTDWLYSHNGNGTSFYITMASLSSAFGDTNDSAMVTDTNCYITYTIAPIGEIPPLTFVTSGC